jgi:DNA-directed RNA polymerase specialized sigma24 family protein
MASANTTSVSSEVLLKAMLALQVADREERLNGGEPRKTDVVLADAGIELQEIATLTGRKYEAVKATVRRARAAAKSSAGKRKPDSD